MAPRESAVAHEAERFGLPIFTPKTLRDRDAAEAMRAHGADAAVVVAYGLILPNPILEAFPLGCFNLHASLLPRWRGAAPIQRAILAGDRETGVSLMQMDAGLDTGAILAQRRVSLDDDTDAARLHASLAELGAQMLLPALSALEAGKAHAEPQSAQGVSYAPKIDKLEARIDWRRSAQEIAHQVRAFNIWPVAETRWQGQQLRIWAARAQPGPVAAGAAFGSEPGDVLGLSGEALQVLCGQGVLAITKLQLAGRRALSAAEFVSGQSLDGARLA
jgi:methionyl-tRNA formyltransferase